MYDRIFTDWSCLCLIDNSNQSSHISWFCNVWLFTTQSRVFWNSIISFFHIDFTIFIIWFWWYLICDQLLSVWTNLKFCITRKRFDIPMTKHTHTILHLFQQVNYYGPWIYQLSTINPKAPFTTKAMFTVSGNHSNSGSGSFFSTFSFLM